MQLTVVVENQTSSQSLLAEWGYSAWLQTEDVVVLLDTGGIQHTLQHNLTALGLEAKRITDLVLSHGHFDHTSGVMDVLRMAPDVRVWAAPGIGRERLGDADAKRASGGGSMLTGLAFSPIDPFVEIVPGVIAFTVPASARDPRWVCTHHMFERTDAGEIVPDTFADDVSLLVQTENGASVLLGCAHAGLPNILRYASLTFDIDHFHTVLGGTHLSGVAPADYPLWMQELTQYKVEHWRPCHCTGFKAAAQLACCFDDVDWASAGTRHRL